VNFELSCTAAPNYAEGVSFCPKAEIAVFGVVSSCAIVTVDAKRLRTSAIAQRDFSRSNKTKKNRKPRLMSTKDELLGDNCCQVLH
jgi:hypothetical protein